MLAHLGFEVFLDVGLGGKENADKRPDLVLNSGDTAEGSFFGIVRYRLVDIGFEAEGNT